MNQIAINDECCGCCICAGACPQECIAMEEDSEGFIYPRINSDLCINCHICEKVCPVIHAVPDEPDSHFEQLGYVVQNKDEKVLRESTAGGAFTAIARYTIGESGVVYGAALNKDLNSTPSAVGHIGVDNEKDLGLFRNSKYVQSFIDKSIIHEIKAFLEQGRHVCFSGTPCQVEGIKRYLDVMNVNQDTLILVDVVCHAIPSPKAFRKYIEYMGTIGFSSIENLRFRDKHYGYKYSTMNVVTDSNHGNYHRGIESDPWLRTYFSNICDRQSCHKCAFKKIHRVSDFTIWDCPNIERFSKKLDNDKGVTRMLVHTRKGKEVFDRISHDLFFEIIEPNILIQGGKSISSSINPHPKRAQFMQDMNSMTGRDLYNKYFPLSTKYKMKHKMRVLILKTGLYGRVKNSYLRTKRLINRVK